MKNKKGGRKQCKKRKGDARNQHFPLQTSLGTHWLVGAAITPPRSAKLRRVPTTAAAVVGCCLRVPRPPKKGEPRGVFFFAATATRTTSSLPLCFSPTHSAACPSLFSPHAMTVARAAVLTAKCAVGATIVVLPSLFALLGAPLAAAVVLLISAASWAATTVVLAAQRTAGTPSYAAALGAALPTPRTRSFACTALSAAIAVFGVGMQAVYVVAITDLVWPATHAAGRRAFMAAATFAIFVPLSAPRSVAASTVAAALGMCAVVLWLVTTAGLAITAAVRGKAHSLPVAPLHRLGAGDIVNSLALVLNGFVVQQATGAIVRDSGVVDRGAAAVGAGLLVTAALYVAVPAAAVILFGAATVNHDVLTNYTPAAVAAIIGEEHARPATFIAYGCRAAVAVCLSTSYPLQHWSARDAVLTLAAGARIVWRRWRAAARPADEERQPSIVGGAASHHPDAAAAAADGATAPDDSDIPLSATDTAAWQTLLGATLALCTISLIAALTARDVAAAVAGVGGTAGSTIALVLPAAVAAAAGRWCLASGLAVLGIAACVGVFVGA